MLKLKILIADEESVSRNVLKSTLLRWGCEVFAVENGEQACATLQAERVDLCILSWNLARLNSVDVCQWIRHAELKKTPYTILLADDPKPEDMRAAYLAGANDFLTKPLHLDEVRERISRVATRVAQVRFIHTQLERMDPLECYRLDLALHEKVYSRV
jgi:DNA-binding response OmpR family regulator